MGIVVGLIRHSVTDWNRDKRLQGQSDVPLNRQGIEESIRLAKYLQGQLWEVIYTSPLVRAERTAQIIAETLSIPIVYSIGLVERKFGLLEGLSRLTIDRYFPRPWDETYLGIEPFSTLVKRAVSTLEAIVQSNYRHILIVSHGAWINALLHNISSEQYGTGKTNLANGSISQLAYTSGHWRIISVNQTLHLQEITGQTN